MPSNNRIHIYKFGGTSVATTDRIRQVVQLVENEPDDILRIVVVSALGGVTDQLIQAIDEALARTQAHSGIVTEIRERHEAIIESLVSERERAAIHIEMGIRWSELGELLDGVFLLRECTLRTRDAIIGMGERLSAPIVAAALRATGNDTVAIDATSMMRSDAQFSEANIQFDETNRLVRERFADMATPRIAVVTGFIASTENGVLTTLGRSGSDYTATILGSALDAERVVIWTDVDGVLSADPRLVPEAFSLPQLSYREAAELAYFGAKVLHPRTMRPVQQKQIPLQIKNTMNPDAPGTIIMEASTHTEGHVKAVTAIRDVSVVMVEGTGMIGVPGISARAFGALADHRINVLMIAQASSEMSLCIVVREAVSSEAVEALKQAFDIELSRGDVSNIYAHPQCAIVSVVGDYMRERHGLAGRMFRTLGSSDINVVAIAQGASETNISAVVRDGEVRPAVQALHTEFALVRRRAHLFIVGTGGVGKTLIRLLSDQQQKLLDNLHLSFTLVGLADIERMVFDDNGITFGEALIRLQTGGERVDLEKIIDFLVASRLNRLILVDATASDDVASRYLELLENNIAVVTPNKRANTMGIDYYTKLHHVSRGNQVPFLYETTVGAGLPVISTLRDLVNAGDRIDLLEGVLSGTLGFIFSRMSDGTAFSEAVREAYDKGYTEPDPRDDLQGDDVRRKLLTLARMMGHQIERADVVVESLVPAFLKHISIPEFLEQISTLDGEWEERVYQASSKRRRLVYLGRIKNGRASVGVSSVERGTPFSRLSGTDNMVVFTTESYADNPLVIQGPGAGREVTAAGILADLIKAAQFVG